MKAIISELWDTGIDIITTEDDSNEIYSISDLKKCENVIIGDRHDYFTEIMLDDSILCVAFRTVSHPTGCGKLQICEIS